MVSPPDTRVSTGILHPCLASPARSLPLSEAWLTDRQRVGVLLQAAGLLSLLDRAGGPLPGWETARIAAGALLPIDRAKVLAGFDADTWADAMDATRSNCGREATAR